MSLFLTVEVCNSNTSGPKKSLHLLFFKNVVYINRSCKRFFKKNRKIKQDILSLRTTGSLIKHDCNKQERRDEKLVLLVRDDDGGGGSILEIIKGLETKK